LSVLFLCYGLTMALFSYSYPVQLLPKMALAPAAGAAASFFIYRRFGYSYAVLAVLGFIAGIPRHLTASTEVQRLLMVGAFVMGVVWVRSARKGHRQDYLGQEYASVEAMVWLAIYLALNLKLTSWDVWYAWRYGGSSVPQLSR